MARPTKYTEETVAKLEQAVRLGAAYKIACAYAGISFETFNEWRKAKPVFSDRIARAEGAGAMTWLARIEKEAADGDWRAASWKLERRYPEDYGKTIQEQQQSGEVTIRFVDESPDADD